MGKVGRWVTDPYTGSYCTLSLDSGDKCNLDSPEGIAALEFLKDDLPLRAFIRCLAIHRRGRPASGAG